MKTETTICEECGAVIKIKAGIRNIGTILVSCTDCTNSSEITTRQEEEEYAFNVVIGMKDINIDGINPERKKDSPLSKIPRGVKIGTLLE